jgi:diacylglycerol kinase (ATP)
MRGLVHLIKERAFYQELLGGMVLVIIELLRNTPKQMLFYIFSSYFLILLTEGVNTAIETIVDRISTERNELAGKAKDIGSTLVFLAILHFCIVWILSFFI